MGARASTSITITQPSDAPLITLLNGGKPFRTNDGLHHIFARQREIAMPYWDEEDWSDPAEVMSVTRVDKSGKIIFVDRCGHQSS